MLQAFVITLREGLEAFLIVAISLAYLRKTGREPLRRPVYWAIGLSLATSAAAGYAFSLARSQSLWEGVLAAVAALLVATLVVHMLRVGRTLGARIQAQLAAAAESPSGRAAWIGVFLFTLLMITREGMEAALLLGTLAFQMKALDLAAGALGGLAAAAVVAVLWARYGHRVDLRRFLQVTALFLLLFVVQLLIYSVHELSEADVFPHSAVIHDATEPYGPDGLYGRWLSFGLVAIPLGFLLVSWVAERLRSKGSPLRAASSA
jgi:high-affinity iron transporter